jgi:acetylornithine/N-succinyldiaminopimelate aminotransferase
LGKALGGGMPLGAFISSTKMMSALTHDPVLGHITTFGGHPVSCAAGKAALEVLVDENLLTSVKEKQDFLLSYLKHPAIIHTNCFGLWMSIQFSTPEIAQSIIHRCVENGLITDWFLFAPDRLRIAPPLTISMEQLKELCDIILRSIDQEIPSNN